LQGSEGLTVSGLAVERSGRPLLAGLAFRVAPGQALAVTGDNGVGKSSLLLAVAGLLPRAAGQVTLRLGRDDDTPLGERLHYLGHGNGLKAALTAATNLQFRQRWCGHEGLSPDAALAAVDLAHCADIPVGLLSAGQKRRVALASLLVSRRSLWLLDEPATALDTRAEATLAGLLADHLAAGGLAVLALHARLDLPMATLRLGHA
jgi:heme exporter protein A